MHVVNNLCWTVLNAVPHLKIEIFHFLDVTISDVLQDISKTVGWNVNVEEITQMKGKTLLTDNTKEALDHGAFGVPRYNEIHVKFFQYFKTLRSVRHSPKNCPK